jgi:arsenate reductase (thioredoxin)
VLPNAVLRPVDLFLLVLLLLLLQVLRLMVEKLVLFLCVENACRSLMAEAMFNPDPPVAWRAISAGTRPASSANPRTRSMLDELGLGSPPHPPQPGSTELMDQAQIRISMGCLDDASCSARLRSLLVWDWGLEDPSKMDDDGFRRVRGHPAALVRGLRAELLLSDRRLAELTSSARS